MVVWSYLKLGSFFLFADDIVSQHTGTVSHFCKTDMQHTDQHVACYIGLCTNITWYATSLYVHYGCWCCRIVTHLVVQPICPAL